MKRQSDSALILGATAGLGRALAENFACRGWNLCLIGRDKRDLDALAADLRLRFGVTIETAQLELEVSCFEKLDFTNLETKPFRAVLVPAGVSFDSDCLSEVLLLDNNLPLVIANTNFILPAKFIIRVIPLIKPEKRSVIIGFGSVAFARGRTRNLFYAASKSALYTFFEGLRHGLICKKIRVQFYVLGYMNTNLAIKTVPLFPKADPHNVAKHVIKNINKDFGVKYYPTWWKPLCFLVKKMPWKMFKRMQY